jgi:hypothetical protein
MLKTRVFFSILAFTSLAGPAMAQDEAFFGWPSAIVFQPYHPWRDSAIWFPAPRGPIPVHVRVYSTPMEPPYYNVPPYIVLDP